MASWAGLTPRHHESDTTVHRGRITKMECGGRSRGLRVSAWGGRHVGGIDIHRAQLTLDYVDLDSGEVFRGRVAPADRMQLRRWLQRFAERTGVAFAVEGCTGWRYVVEELQIAARRGRNIATVAAARKLIGLVFYGLRDHEIRFLASAGRAA